MTKTFQLNILNSLITEFVLSNVNKIVVVATLSTKIQSTLQLAVLVTKQHQK